MRLGPGKHLEGRLLMDGVVKPEEVGIHSFFSMRLRLVRFHSLIISTS